MYEVVRPHESTHGGDSGPYHVVEVFCMVLQAAAEAAAATAAAALARGKRGKAKKAKEKYANQDDEDRQLALQFLAPAGGCFPG
jgi:hypothetical protein